MADKRRFLDVWIVESNTVYREVPFTVVADWVQQGRLLEDDMIKPSGTAEWSRVGASPDFSAYVPKPQAYRTEDQAEALEPVQLDFHYKRRHEEEDDDVDMIPLIDVSLVLLIFFMLLSAGAGVATAIQVPAINNPTVAVINPEEVTVGIDLRDGQPLYSLSDRQQAARRRRPPGHGLLRRHEGEASGYARRQRRVRGNDQRPQGRPVRAGPPPDGRSRPRPAQRKGFQDPHRRQRETVMSTVTATGTWKIRHEGSPRSVDNLTLAQILEGLQDGLWEATDEVMGPNDAAWVAIENHPQLAEVAADLEPPPQRTYDDETRLDMNALIDVCLVLLIFFMLITSYAVLQKRLEQPPITESGRSERLCEFRQRTRSKSKCSRSRSRWRAISR